MMFAMVLYKINPELVLHVNCHQGAIICSLDLLQRDYHPIVEAYNRVDSRIFTLTHNGINVLSFFPLQVQFSAPFAYSLAKQYLDDYRIPYSILSPGVIQLPEDFLCQNAPHANIETLAHRAYLGAKIALLQQEIPPVQRVALGIANGNLELISEVHLYFSVQDEKLRFITVLSQKYPHWIFYADPQSGYLACNPELLRNNEVLNEIIQSYRSTFLYQMLQRTIDNLFQDDTQTQQLNTRF
jgi:hypothetical protein